MQAPGRRKALEDISLGVVLLNGRHLRRPKPPAHASAVGNGCQSHSRTEANLDRGGTGGSGVVRIKVPRKAIRMTNQKGGKEFYFGVDPAYLTAFQKRRVANARRKAKGMSPIKTRIRAGTKGTTTRIASQGSRRIR